ncbi:MAG: amino acid adenylation domain-containing protein [Acidobacteria bacterium]|nr:amino acid adenylation domain-containing protein [Acidobacteriota bacterium]
MGPPAGVEPPAGVNILECLHRWIEQYAEAAPHAPFLLSERGEALCYGELRDWIGVLARELRGFGVGGSDCVAVALPDGPELALAALGVSSAAVCAPLYRLQPAAEAEACLRELGARAVLVRPGETGGVVAAARALGLAVLEAVGDGGAPGAFRLAGAKSAEPASGGLLEPHDAALALYTSGTESRPRLVLLTQANLTAAAESIRDALELTAADRSLTAMPLFHIHGLSTIFASLTAGASVVCPEDAGADRLAELLAEAEPSWYSAAPAIHRMMLEELRRRPELAERTKLRLARSASAPMPPTLLAELEEVLRAPLLEAYGLTEAAPQVASNRLPPTRRKPGSAGRAAGPEIAILGEAGAELPPGWTGEIAIRGANVAAGYANDPAATARALRGGWLRTGDLGHLDEDGYLFVTGRRKRVINRGGEKISPREVEETLLGHPAVREAAVFAAPHATLGENVAAAVVLDESVGPGAAESQLPSVRAWAAERLSASKTPQQILVVDKMPLGPTGKVDVAELVRRLASREAPPQGPATPAELRLAALWMEVLGCEAPRRDDNFFALGGHSLAAARVAARLRQELRAELPLARFFDRPTLREMAVALEGAGSSDAVAAPVRSAAGPCPLSWGQRSLWFLDRFEGGSPAYNVAASLRLTGPLDRDALETALRQVLERHEPLRMAFWLEGDEPVQEARDGSELRLESADLTGLPEAGREVAAQRMADEEARRPFELERPPLLRVRLLRLGPEDHALLMTMHHIVSDGWSVDVLHAELAALYAAALGRREPPPRPRGRFTDWVRAERARLEGGAIEHGVAYFCDRLRDAPPALELPTDRPRPALQTARGARRRSVIASETVEGLARLAAESGATLYMTALAAFQALLGRLTGQQDIVVGTPVANRPSADVERLIGCFANTLALRTRLDDDPPFRELVERVKEVALGAFEWAETPFEKVVEALHPVRDPSRTPVFQAMFAFQSHAGGVAGAAPPFGPELSARPLATQGGGAKFDLTLYLTPTTGGLEAVWQYNEDLFDAATVDRFAARYEALLRGAVADASRRLSELPVADRAERRLVEEVWGRGAPAPPVCLAHELFEQRAALADGAPAAEDGEGTWSYGELNRRANRWAHALLRRGAGASGEERLIGLCLPRTREMAAGALAVWKAGYGCVPLEPCDPPERLAYLAADAGVSLILAPERLAPRLEAALRNGRSAPAVVTLESLDAAEGPEENPGLRTRPEETAYVIYTSGTTGRPKGVRVTHANLGCYAQALTAALGLAATDRYLHTAALTFSSAMRQLVAPLTAGSCVVVASREQVRDQEALFRLILEARVTVADLAPSYWRSCLRALQALRPDRRAALLENRLRLLLSASEPLPWALVEEWRALGLPGSWVNLYGQTETTGIVTTFPLPAEPGGGSVVPLGRPIAGARVRVLDAAGGRAPAGSFGELWVGGSGVSQGYLGDAERTAERFATHGGQRWYRTGDRVRFLPGGALEFGGRLDEQIKIRGYRVEPGEIEAALLESPLVAEAAVTLDAAAEPARLAAFVVPAPGVDAGSLPGRCRRFLEERLPGHLVPAAIAVREDLPRTSSGKVVRVALAEQSASLPTLSRRGGAGEPEPAESEEAVARILAEIWREVLRVGRVGLDDNFFDLGGDSVRSVQIVTRAREEGLEIRLADLFLHQTVGGLARAVKLSAEGGEEAAADEEEAPVRVSAESLRAWGREALERAGLDPAGAAIVTEVQLESSLRGQPTHNIADIPRYARRLAAGVLNPRSRIRVVRETAVNVLFDADNAPGQWAATVAMETAIRKARESGVCLAGVRRSNHFGAAGHYVWMAAREGLVGVCTTNGPLILAPTGGTTPTFGNNPIAVGLPAARRHPIVLDIALSAAPRGKIGLRLAEGKPLEQGWILDAQGRPSTDLADLAEGLGMPIGGHKGYGLALAMEGLAGVLTGAGFCWDHEGHRGDPRPGGLDLGHLMIAIDPELFGSTEEFRARVDRMIEQTKSGALAAGATEILTPGEPEMRARERNLREGVPLRASAYRTVQRYTAQAGLRTKVEPLAAAATAVGD